jgi:hypothetical protein
MLIKPLYVWMLHICSIVLGESSPTIKTPGNLFTKTRRLAFHTLPSLCIPVLVLSCLGSLERATPLELKIIGRSYHVPKLTRTGFANENGVKTGVNTHILSGLEHQCEILDEVLKNLLFTFVEFMTTTLNNVWSEYLARGGGIQPAEAFLVFCAIMQHVFREFRNFRQHGTAAIQQGSVAQRVSNTWWYVLQTHQKMAEFMQVGLKQHPAITPVFTSHLYLHRVSKTSFTTLETFLFNTHHMA